tara:strand:- start:53 stop:739 length:687 start_codon:yes stop_codon:yes gene_type:complete
MNWDFVKLKGPKKKVVETSKTFKTKAKLFPAIFSYGKMDGSTGVVSNNLKKNLAEAFGKAKGISYGYQIRVKKAFRYLLPVGDSFTLYIGHSIDIADRHYRHFKGLNSLKGFTTEKFEFWPNMYAGNELAQYIVDRFFKVEGPSSDRFISDFTYLQNKLDIKRISDIFEVYVETLTDANTETGDEEVMMQQRFVVKNNNQLPVINRRLEGNNRIKTLVAPSKVNEFID